MIFSFHPQAEAELNSAIDYYENAQPGLGQEFAVEVLASIERAVEHPKAWVIFDSEIKGGPG